MFSCIKYTKLINTITRLPISDWGTNITIMARDLRVYKYIAGGMHKVGRSHKNTNIRDCMTVIKHFQKDSTGQYLIVEYTDKYKSEIIYVSPLDLAKTI